MTTNRYQFINLDYLDIMCDGDTDMRITLIEMLIEELPADVSSLRSFAQVGSWNEISALSHKLKTSLSYTGNSVIITAATAIEKNAKDGTSLSSIPDLIATMEILLKGIIPELQLELEKL